MKRLTLLLFLLPACVAAEPPLLCVQNMSSKVVVLFNKGDIYNVYHGNAVCFREGPVQILP